MFSFGLHLMYFEIFGNFHTAFTQSLDYFTILGTDEPLPEPWEYLGPMIALNGIVIIAFASIYPNLS